MSHPSTTQWSRHARRRRLGAGMLAFGVISMTLGTLVSGAAASPHDRTYWFEFADGHEVTGSTSGGDAEVHGMTIHVSCSDTFADGWSDDASGHPNPTDDPQHRIVDFYIEWEKDGQLFKTCGEQPTTTTTDSTTTTTTTTSTTTTTTSTTTSTTTPEEPTSTTAPPTTVALVGGVTEERPTTTAPPTTAAQVKGEVLARTGGDVQGWLFLAGLALFVGGIAMMFGETVPAPTRR